MPSKDPKRIQSMFGAIAPLYDFFNHAFSLNIDSRWRRLAAREALSAGHRRVLDVACGTGDLAIALKQHRPESQVVGLDFCEPMLRLAQRKSRLPFLNGDGLALPFRDSTFDVVTIAFGLRNMASMERGLEEMARVLRPGGRLAVLEFTTPANPLIRRAYLMYFKYLLPLIGDLVSRTKAYKYLSESVLEWPSPPELARAMRRCGFARVRWRMLTLGIAVLHIAERGGKD